MTDEYDLVIIGAGEAGQAAAHLARHRGALVAIIDRELFGGSCPFWACMPSKALLHAAAQHACGDGYPWQRASDFRDWMIVRERPRDWPDDSGHVKDLETAGATVIRGAGRIDGPGHVVVRTADGERRLGARAILVAVGSNSTIPDDIEGLDQIRPWTNREATTARELPRSLVILGAGPTGVEMAQVYARYGVPTTLVSPHDRINPNDHPRSSATIDHALRRDGVDIRTNVRATSVRARAGHDHAHVLSLASLKGRPVWINFWATWCPPCQRETPVLRDAYEAHKGEGLVLVAVDVQETPDTAREYATRYGLTYTIGLDVTGAVFRTYRIFGLPSQYFIDRDGVIRGRYFGPLTREQVEEQLRVILSP